MRSRWVALEVGARRVAGRPSIAELHPGFEQPAERRLGEWSLGSFAEVGLEPADRGSGVPGAHLEPSQVECGLCRLRRTGEPASHGVVGDSSVFGVTGETRRLAE